MVIGRFRRAVLTFPLCLMLQLGSYAHAGNDAITPETWITVFVHGIISIRPHLSFSNFMRFIKDEVQDTPYARTVELMRQDPVFYQNQAMQEIGLKKVDPVANLQKNNASGALAMVFESMSQFAHAGKPVINHYYTFGWTGLMSPTQRYLDSCHLYKGLAQEVAKFRAQGIEPKIRVIGYSHGGNVCLNLARVRQSGHIPGGFTINELVLMGMPVQHETDFLVSDPLFEKVYHVYSRGDRVQKLDPFSLKRFFSRRLFKPRSDFKLPDKLIQIQIKYTRMTASCSASTQQRRLDHRYHAYNFNSGPVVGGKAHFMRDASPGHTELWFFGWTPVNYRPYFPLNPFPVVAIMPIILQAVNDFQERNQFNKPTLIDIRPDHEIMIIKNQKSHRVLTFARFLSQAEMKKLTDIVLQYAPDNYTLELYDSHIKAAYDQAHNEYGTYIHHKKQSRRDRKKQCQQERLARKSMRRQQKLNAAQACTKI